MYVLLAPHDAGHLLQRLAADGTALSEPWLAPEGTLAQAVEQAEAWHDRWVWDNTTQLYPAILSSGARVEKCHDLALTRNLLTASTYVPENPAFRQASAAWARESFIPAPPVDPLAEPARPREDSLFDAAGLPDDPGQWGSSSVNSEARGLESLRAELVAQLSALTGSTHPARLRLLVAAESAAALVAAEMQYIGVPWNVRVHRDILEEALGPEPTGLRRPAKMAALVEELRSLLNSPALNPDSPQDLLRSLHRNGIEVKTTRKWELERIQHPAIAPLLEYKKMSRLFSANGWVWLQAWAHDGRFRPEYVVGGVVSGRWASRGGGALQIPRTIRRAVQAEEGHVLVVADASQLEPRILSAMSQDRAMAAAGRGQDLYAGIAKDAFDGDRSKAKVAVLGAIYGATQGDSGALVPALRKLYPQALDMVEQAARTGEKGGTVTTWLGRSSPDPGPEWRSVQQTSTEQEQRRADAWARSRGRFTRNFIVQGTAAEWAECWLAAIRRRLVDLPGAELVFFLHDEVMLHVPQEHAEAAAAVVRESAAEAGRLLFGSAPVEFALTVATVSTYDQAK